MASWRTTLRGSLRQRHAIWAVCLLWTADLSRSLHLARSIEAGQVFVNNYGSRGGVELPFWGTVKGYGFGREKGFEALYGFGGLKTVNIRHGL